MSDKLCAVVGVGPKMGQAICRAFAEAGYDVALVSRNSRNLEPYAEQVEKLGRSAILLEADATDSGQIEAAFDTLISRRDVPEVVVYNIAVMTREAPSSLTPDGLGETLQANLFGAINSTAAVLPAMRRRGSGVLLYTGGGYGIEPSAERANHSVGKAALRTWVHALHKELTPEGLLAATVTITRPVKSGTDYDPDFIAGLYVELASQSPPDWKWEIVHKDL